MDSFDQLCNEFHHFIFHEIKSDVEIDVSYKEFVTAIKFLDRIEIFVKKNRETLYQESKFKFKFIQNNPNFLRDIEDLKKWVEEMKAESEKPTRQKYPAQYYAFYHWILIKLGKEDQFKANDNGQWPKEEMMVFFKNKYPEQKSHQGIYIAFIGMDITNKNLTSVYLKKGYKEIIQNISNNDPQVAHFLEKWPNPKN